MKEEIPLVLTFDGYVVNGDRRLAILRELENVTHVDAVVLPADADSKDISGLEMRLQMAEDGKAEYNWLDALLTIEANITEVGFTEEEVAREMGCYPKTIQLQRHELDLVNRYLAERGYPGEHFRVESDKQAFETLARAHRDTSDPDRQANLRSLGFNIIARPAAGSSVHRQIEAMIRNLDTTVDMISRQQDEEDDTPDDSCSSRRRPAEPAGRYRRACPHHQSADQRRLGDPDTRSHRSGPWSQRGERTWHEAAFRRKTEHGC